VDGAPSSSSAWTCCSAVLELHLQVCMCDFHLV
jgi:hypothetical protein